MECLVNIVNIILKKIDNAICHYLGITHEHIKPVEVSIVNGVIIISNTYPYQRHLVTESWENFSNYGIHKTNEQEKIKLGLATGKIIANELIISFEDITIKKLTHAD
ncbi:MAG: hypothetical protein Tsb005_06280 [Gammaproteobacteria bacterium]